MSPSCEATGVDVPAEPRFGMSADVRFEKSIEELAGFAADRGLNHLELRAGYLEVNEVPAARKLREISRRHGVTYTIHAPHIDCALGNVNETLRRASVEAVKESLDLAAAIDAGGVIVHGGSAERRYPDHVNDHERAQALASLRACVTHAEEVGVPLCLENSRDKSSERRFTGTPERLATLVEDVGIDSPYFRFTLDVGHAKATGVDYEEFVDRFGDRIRVVHLHDNDGTGDDHDPLPEFRSVARSIGAPYNVLEMKSLGDVDRCVCSGATAEST